MPKWILTLLCIATALLYLPASAHATDGGADTVRQFYSARAGQSPIWTARDRFSPRAQALPGIISQLSAANGLEADTYGVTGMQALLDTPPASPEDWQRAEILWTYNLWLIASDLAGYAYQDADLTNLLRGNLKSNLNALVPATPLYKAMQEKLAALDAGTLPARLDLGRGILRPGAAAPGVVALRAHMLESGYLTPELITAHPMPDAETAYDPALVEAVKAFQRDHALQADGAIGPATLAVLNPTPQQMRIRLVANMQRLREPLRRTREPKRVEVSIARYHMDAYEGGKPVLSMPVIVGQPRRQTISFRTEISGVRLNPAWNVPRTIKNEDYIPLLFSDPARLTNRYGVRVIKNGQPVDPATVDWTQKSQAELASLRMWHPAGAGNPLGLHRVIMENPYDIYLHDTNAPRLFENSGRALSSGCIRVADPDALTAYILKEKSDWSAEKTKQILASGKTTNVIIENKIPIYLDYITVWFNDRAQLVLGADIYALDKPRYDGQINKVLTTQRNREKLLEQATALLQPEYTEDRPTL